MEQNRSFYNLEQAIQTFSKDMSLPPDVYRTILISSIKPAQEDLSHLDQALQDQNWDTIQMISHRLKGTYSNLRLNDLADLAEQMNDLSRSRKDITEVINLSLKFNNIFVSLRKALEQ